MDQLHHYTSCPVCTSNQIQKSLLVKDYSVSSENFEIWTCTACSFRFTQDIPTQSQIGKYYRSDNYISHTNTSKGLINRLYLFIRKITLCQKRSLLQSSTGLNTGTLLDIGAGTGAFASFMKSSGWRVTGLEPDQDARNRASSINGISLLPSDQLFAFPPESFDCITLWHVLEHVHELDAYMKQLYKILKPKGRLLIAVPNYTSSDAEHYQEHWAAYDVPRHLYHFSPASMRALLNIHQFRLSGIKPMWFDSFYVSMLSEKYKTGKSGVLAGSLQGWLSNTKALFNKERCSSLIYIIQK
jgi:2-polyprenyl-3-methyl-5-hydroxy-6-metoxy-1,4-benzoquinol methylase